MANNAEAVSPVWPGPSLMVPMTVDCLLVGEPDRFSTWAKTQFNYTNLANGFLPDAAPPFSIQSPAPAVGAHLLWTLPFALRHGVQQENGDIQFPLAPNRWMVTRALYTQPGAAPVLSAGVIQSDLLSKLTDSNSSQYPDPAAPGTTRQIGGYVPIENWTSPVGPAAPFLRAVGPGELSWSVAYDNVKKVFSFYDNLSNIGPAMVTYSVIGWFAEPSFDPLFLIPVGTPFEWQDAVEQKFEWSVGTTPEDVLEAQADWEAWSEMHGLNGSISPDLPPQYKEAIEKWLAWQAAHGVAGPKPALPQQTLSHGVVETVEWKGAKFAYGTGAPGGGKALPKVAVGSTAAEAIAAWIATEVTQKNARAAALNPTIETAVEAFQKGLIFELAKDPVATERLLHSARFDVTHAGATWIVVRPESDPQNPAPYSGQQTLPLDPPLTAALTKLNADQSELNFFSAQLFTLRSELFAVQFKDYNLPLDASPAIKTAVGNALAALNSEIPKVVKRIQELEGSIELQAEAFRTATVGLYQLRLVEKGDAYAPLDPAILLAGARIDTKFAAPGTYDEHEVLFTRFTGQTVTGIETDYAGSGIPSDTKLITAADLLAHVILPQGAGLPKEAPDLLVEMLFLDRSLAQLLAKIYFDKRGIQPSAGVLAELTAIIQEQQTPPWRQAALLGVSRRALAAALGLKGVPPSPVAVEYRDGQPWSPVYIDWKVRWFPTSTDPEGQLKNWKLGEIDYEWEGTQVPQPPNPIQFLNRTVLNPKIAQDVAAQLETFHDDPEYDSLPLYIRQALDAVGKIIGRFDVVTQTLGGFTQQLCTRMIAPSQQPASPLLGNTTISFRPVTGDVKSIQPLPFFPIRSGHFQVIDLWVVDAFGQILRGKDPNLGPNSPIPNLIRAESVMTAAPANVTYVQLPPRVSQPSQVSFTLLDASDDQIPSSSADSTNPICGWVMPNHLDDALSVFGPKGDAFGELIRVDTETPLVSTETAVRWDTAPGTNAALGAPPQLPNIHLERFAIGLLQRGLTDGGQVLEDLLDAIDSSLWQVDPLSASEGNLSVLVGRPLAVIRARLSLHLHGYPEYNQSWMETGRYYTAGKQFNPKPPPFVSVKLRLRVGDLADSTNGVLGYFLNDDYRTFYAVHGAGKQTSPLRRALKSGWRAADALSPALADRLTPSAESGYVQFGNLIDLSVTDPAVYLTLLVDPRGAIPVITGSLPTSTTLLAPGPVTEALRNIRIDFRVGPLLVEPGQIKMPIPAEIKGQWSWVARIDVTSWSDPATIGMTNPIADLVSAPPALREGWLSLTGALDDEP